MTNKTYDQLWWDKEFVEKRIREQEDYISDIHHNWALHNLKLTRANELLEGATHILNRFKRQLEKIKKLI